jgi:site-specific recombinase XerC
VSALAHEHLTDLTLEEAQRIIRAALKDKSYRVKTGLGPSVGDYCRWKKNEWGATELTMLDYEAILARLALFHPSAKPAQYEPPDGTELLRECWDRYWGDAAGRTRAKVRSVWVDFFDWAVRERRMVGNPARALASPKKRDVLIETFSREFVAKVLAGQDYLPDRLGCTLILVYGLRRGALSACQFKHFNFDRRELTVFTKGGRIYPIPIVQEDFWRDLGAAQLELRLGPGDWLINWRTDTRRRRVPLDEATETLELGNGERVGYAWLTSRRHDQQPTGKRMHLWWYRCLERAGLVKKGTTSGANMHRGRHTSVTNLLRDSGNLELARKLAGHKDIRTTAMYAHLETSDLDAALRAMVER